MPHYHDLKIKHSLAAQEIVMQRRVQQKLTKSLAWATTQGKNSTNQQAGISWCQSRRAKLRVEARHLHLAKMYRKGTPYAKVETHNKDGEYKAINDTLTALTNATSTAINTWVQA